MPPSSSARNPAVGIGPVLANLINGLDTFPRYAWIYLVGHSRAAALIFYLQHLGNLGVRSKQDD